MNSYQLTRLDALPQGKYGQKARRLYELSQKGFPICEGFALPEDWMEDFLDCNGIARESPQPGDIFQKDL